MMRRKIVPIVICTAVFMAIPSVSAFALDGWQQDAAQEWIYKEMIKTSEPVDYMDGRDSKVCGRGREDC